MKPAPAQLEAVSEEEPLTLSSLLNTVFKNYGTYFETREQLHSLQEWVREQEKIYNDEP